MYGWGKVLVVGVGALVGFKLVGGIVFPLLAMLAAALGFLLKLALVAALVYFVGLLLRRESPERA